MEISNGMGGGLGVVGGKFQINSARPRSVLPNKQTEKSNFLAIACEDLKLRL